MKKVFKWVGILAGLWIAAAVIWALVGGGGGDPSVVSIVKNGKLQACPDYTVEQLADALMASPRWEGVVAKDGKEYVSLAGSVAFESEDQPVDTVMQFSIDRDSGTFGLRALEMAGVPRNKRMQAQLVQEMCERAAQ